MKFLKHHSSQEANRSFGWMRKKIGFGYHTSLFGTSVGRVAGLEERNQKLQHIAVLQPATGLPRR